jgi:hypothetical protein
MVWGRAGPDHLARSVDARVGAAGAQDRDGLAAVERGQRLLELALVRRRRGAGGGLSGGGEGSEGVGGGGGRRVEGFGGEGRWDEIQAFWAKLGDGAAPGRCEELWRLFHCFQPNLSP